MSRTKKKSHPRIRQKTSFPQRSNARSVVKGITCNFDGQSPPPIWPTVSLCMIVKNEAEHLSACLESVGNFPSEIIIVDTGSTDSTVEIARSFGAKVKYFPWINDFAAARNASIEEAGGEWIFWMDADDRLTPTEVIRLKQAVVSNKADVYMCQVVSKGPKQGGADANVEHLRLFRNHLNLYFEYSLHETIMPGVIRQGLLLARTNIIVTHTGYHTTPAEFKAKAQRNLTIINQELASMPNNLYWRYHRGAVAAILEDFDQASADYEAVIADPPAELNWDIYVYQAHTGLFNIYRNSGKINEARRVLDLTLTRFSQRRHLTVLAGHFYLMQDELEEALASLRRAKSLPADSNFLGQTWPPGRLEWVLGQVYLLAGDLPRAGETYRAMLSQMGRQIETEPSDELERARALFEAGEYAAVFEILEPIAPGNPVVLRLLASTEHHRQNWYGAAACLSQAIALSGPQDGEWAILAEYILRTRRFASAERLCHLALAEDNQNVEALNLLGIIAMQRNDTDQAMLHLVRARLANSDHLWVQDNLTQLATALRLPLTEALRRHGQHMIQQQQYVPAIEAFSLLLELLPTDPEVYKSLAVALNGLGRWNDALLAWQAAQELASQSGRVA